VCAQGQLVETDRVRRDPFALPGPPPDGSTGATRCRRVAVTHPTKHALDRAVTAPDRDLEHLAGLARRRMALQQQPDVDPERSTESDCLRSATGRPSTTRTPRATTSASLSASRASLSSTSATEGWAILPFMTMAPVGALLLTGPSSKPARSARSGPESVRQVSGLGGGQLDDQAPATLERDAHHDAAPLLGDLERTVTRPRLHRRHRHSPSSC
jgi:hypothetical protein